MNHYDGPDLDKDVSEIDKEPEADFGEEAGLEAEEIFEIETELDFAEETADEYADETLIDYESDLIDAEIDINDSDGEEAAVEEETGETDHPAEDEADKMEYIDVADDDAEEAEEPQEEEETAVESDEEPEPDELESEDEEPAEYDAEIPETPQKGVYEYTLLEIGGLKEVERVEFHPSGDYFAALVTYNVVHVSDWNAG